LYFYVSTYVNKIIKCILMKTIVIILLLLLPATSLFCQEEPAALNDDEIKEVLGVLAEQLNENYVFPETGEQMSGLLKTRIQSGEYRQLRDGGKFAEKLTQDLQKISGDKHLRILFAPQRVKEMRDTTTPEDSLAFVQREMEKRKRDNFGFKEVKLLEGNIGYLDLRGFSNTDFAGETAIAAMNFLSNADALIIDLRKNGGGSPSMIQLISSYLFGSQTVNLNNFYFRPTDEHTQTWTLPYVPGKRRPDIDVYVLTSNYTFSAAEEFSYNLKNLERATLIGETTGGGAHPISVRIISDRFLISLPTGRAINPITETNWEGVGVEPHIQVEAGRALETAHLKALEVLAEKNPDDHFYSWHYQGLKALNEPVNLPVTMLSSYAGEYGPRKLILEKDRLFYQREGQERHPLLPLDTDLFAVEDIPYFRIKIVKENDKILGITGIYDDGRQSFSARK
jgi:retinol-binding protein 3